jgi:hypothetical protein
LALSSSLRLRFGFGASVSQRNRQHPEAIYRLNRGNERFGWQVGLVLPAVA